MSQSWLKKKSNALELYTVDVILGRRRTGTAIYAAFLHALSFIFSALAQLRFWLYPAPHPA
jgi:tetraacyldisaccharide 4'-kinase